MRSGKPFSKKHMYGKYAAGEKKSRHAMEEFGPGAREFIFCPHGEAVYYKKSWHHTSDFFLRPLNVKEEKGVRFRLCPAHKMIKNKQYEGAAVIKNVPIKFRSDLLHLIKNMGERAMRIDVLDRVLEIKTINQEIRVTTSENQLAQKIARKIKEAFKKQNTVVVSRPADSDVVHIKIEFTP